MAFLETVVIVIRLSVVLWWNFRFPPCEYLVSVHISMDSGLDEACLGVYIHILWNIMISGLQLSSRYAVILPWLIFPLLWGGQFIWWRLKWNYIVIGYALPIIMLSGAMQCLQWLAFVLCRHRATVLYLSGFMIRVSLICGATVHCTYRGNWTMYLVSGFYDDLFLPEVLK